MLVSSSVCFGNYCVLIVVDVSVLLTLDSFGCVVGVRVELNGINVADFLFYLLGLT